MGNIVVYILVLFVLAALLRVDFFFTILYLFIGVYIATRFWSRRMLKHIKIDRQLPERAFLGEQLRVTLTIENLSRLPVPWLMINEIFSNVLSSPPFFREVITLGGRAKHTVQYDLFARRRGYYQVGPLLLETGDLLAISGRLTAKFTAAPLIVYPKILPIMQLRLPTFSPQVILPTTVPLFHDSTRITGVRGYVPGDNPRHIHWPATAAAGQMLVKQFQTAIARENVIFLNMDRADYGRPGQADIALELAIVAVASLANHIITVEDLPVGLTTSAFDPLKKEEQQFRLAPDKGQPHLMHILEILARIEGIDETHFLERLRQEVVHLAWGTTITIVTATESELLLRNILLLKKAGFHVAVILVQPRAYSYPKTHRIQGLGIPTFMMTRETDIEVWQPVV